MLIDYQVTREIILTVVIVAATAVIVVSGGWVRLILG